MKRILTPLIYISILMPYSCEKSNSNSCPDLIKNANLQDYPMDFYGINEVKLAGNQLLINVSYGGGCEEHYFNLILDTASPIDGGGQQIEVLHLSHNANNDACNSQIIEHQLCFDISNLEIGYLLYLSHPDSLYELNI
ncbi:MAG: hypothetical protein P8N54_01885 [Flavobacteriales bacterium]|nr:hypothetical protein [Flavobacteriales bacterium]